MKRNLKTYTPYLCSLVMLLLVSCTPTSYDPIPPEELMGVERAATYTIAELKKEFGVKENIHFGVNSVHSREDVIIKGIVTSTDVEGNIYKYITLQEEKKGGEAIKISIDAGSLSGQYPLGQRITVKCNDLALGNYAQSPQLGVKYYNERRGRVEPGRMPKATADAIIQAYGMPDPTAIPIDTMTIADIVAAGATMYSRLVCIKNAHFTGNGADYGKPSPISNKADRIYAPSTDGIGYPQSREIQDGTGSIFVSTSEYARFANTPLPASDQKGTITAIVGWYNDRDETQKEGKIYHQLTLRSLKDVQLK